LKHEPGEKEAVKMEEVTCPWCGSEVRLSGIICPVCRHEVLPEHLVEKEGVSIGKGDAQQIEDDGDSHESQAIENSFVCAKCGHEECKVAEVAMTGPGLSKLMNIQHHHYLFVSCLSCAAVEIYDPSVLRGRQAGALSTLLDLL
jgi:predicted nucleic-acid-binding Zn-ribbon protein